MVKNLPANSKRPGFDPPVRMIPWRRYWQPTPVFLPGKFHGQRNLAVYSPWGHKESDMTERLNTTNIETYFREIDDFHLRWSWITARAGCSPQRAGKPLQGRKSVMCSVCQCRWYKYFHCGQFQEANSSLWTQNCLETHTADIHKRQQLRHGVRVHWVHPSLQLTLRGWE